MSLKETILAAADDELALRSEVVPEWGVTVFYRGWTAKERDRFERDFGDMEGDGRDNLRARVLVRFLLDEKGERIFADSDAEALGAKGQMALVRLFRLVTGASGATAADVEAAKKN